MSAGLKQSQASDPQRSVWVGASAGTGKTKVLIDRVLRLMLPRPRRSGADTNLGAGTAPAGEPATPPEKILCLTFTKTAAAEMSTRIYERLSGWSVKSDAELQAELESLTGAPPATETLRAARRLFARVLDAAGGLKIMTLHAFCQSVLKRFPVEAGLSPHFEMMDEQDAVDTLTKCQHEIIAQARSAPATPLARAFGLLAVHLDSEALSGLMRLVMSKRSLLAQILKRHGDEDEEAEGTISALYQTLRLPRDITEAALLAKAARPAPEDEANLRAALAALLQGSDTDREKAAHMQPWLERPAQRGELLPAYCRAFFTAAGEIAKRLGTREAQKHCPGLIDIMQREAERLAAVQQEIKAVRLAEINAALLTVSAAMLGRYERRKRARDKLDFDDLIIKTCDLLASPDMASWVLYKLDEGIDHILVDEAQDTSRNQWRVVEALSGEFFSGLGSRESATRTLFVVGDEKQSIFSFQGADPYEFARMQHFFGERVAGVQEGWEIFLEYSFRSTRAVLTVVDNVFKSPDARKGVAEREVLHLPFRAGQAGLVELWPLVKTEKKPPPSPWPMPVAIDAGDNAASRLADKIAATVRGWLDSGEQLESRARPIRAGDILVLVQSRGAFVELLTRALKKQDVPVAGVDRLVLTEEIAVMDLLALAAFALQPRDDLTLATLLKSPLVGFTEQELYDAGHGRDGTLWNTLRDRRPDAAAWLRGWIERGGKATPYAFFAEALSAPCFADAVSGRRAFYSRLGPDVHDALDEFLSAALRYEQSHTPALQAFVDWFVRGESDIKREQEPGGVDQVRIMTVHASKGLQAPIVFLPDTVKKMHDHHKGREHLLWPEDETGVPLWSPRAEFEAPAYTARQMLSRERQEEEYRRLLYVALTRAEDRLYICGHHGVRGPRPDCWYSLVDAAFPPAEEGEEIRRLSCPQEAEPERKTSAQTVDVARTPLPAWVGKPVPAEPSPARPLAPSRPDDEEPAVKGPLAEDQSWKFRRGVIVHRALETLPQLPVAAREGALLRYLARHDIPAGAQAAFAAEILAVLNHPGFAPIFGPGSRAEAPVTGLVGDRVVSGQIDRMLVTEKEVLIIDYKTNRPPPQRAEDVPAIYLKQMAAYRAVIHKIYPDRTVRCALLWTDGPRLMELP